MAIRPQRVLPADAALVNGAPLSATGIIKNNASGLNIATNTNVNNGSSVSTGVLDLSGYRCLALWARASLGNVAAILTIIDPLDATSTISAITSVASLGASNTLVQFGNVQLTTNVPLWLCKLTFTNNGAAPASLNVSTLFCSSV